MCNIKGKILALAVLAIFTETASEGMRSLASSKLHKVQGNLLPIRSGTRRPPKPVPKPVLPYVQIAPSGNYCKKKGTIGHPRRCEKYLGGSTNSGKCESFCDGLIGCTGYSHRFNDGLCRLYTREDRCPNPLSYKNGPIITGINQFEGMPGQYFTGCYAKTCLMIGGECIAPATILKR